MNASGGLVRPSRIFHLSQRSPPLQVACIAQVAEQSGRTLEMLSLVIPLQSCVALAGAAVRVVANAAKTAALRTENLRNGKTPERETTGKTVTPRSRHDQSNRD